MKIAVIQHRLRSSAEQDARALAAAATAAAEGGAQLVVLPEVRSLSAGAGDAAALFEKLMAEVPAFCLIPHLDPALGGVAFCAELPPESGFPAGMGRASLLAGDACMNPEQLAGIAAEEPALAVLVPRSESDLQAEAVLELAIALSDSLAGLVLVAECAGAEPGAVGHGGSAIVVVGEVVAEAMGEDDILFADVVLPIAQPQPREALPPIPPILAQRVAVHEGRGPDAPEYPAELS